MASIQADATTSEKDFSLTFCQVISAFAVLILHANGCFWEFPTTENYWVSANIIECVFYFGVPVFFMITGVTLIDYQERYSTREYIKKRIMKTLIPYLAWTLIHITIMLITGLGSNKLSPMDIINGFIGTESVVDHYWFFHFLFVVYLCIPLFAAVEKKKRSNTFKYLIVIGFISNVLVPFILSGFQLNLDWPYTVSVVAGYLIFVLGGYYIYNNPPQKYVKIVIYTLAIAGLFMHIVGTYILSMKFGEIHAQFKGYTNLPSVLYSFGVFILLRDIASLVEKATWLKKLVLTLGKYSFAVFLIQWSIYLVIGHLFEAYTASLLYRLVLPIIIYIVIMFVTWCLRKIPLIKYIVP